jgi:hypothetical protein
VQPLVDVVPKTASASNAILLRSGSHRFGHGLIDSSGQFYTLP